MVSRKLHHVIKMPLRVVPEPTCFQRICSLSVECITVFTIQMVTWHACASRITPCVIHSLKRLGKNKASCCCYWTDASCVHLYLLFQH